MSAEPQMHDRVLDLPVLWHRIWARRVGIAALVIIAAVATAIVSLVLPTWYRAQASLLPPSEEESGFGIASLFRGIGVPGIKIPTQATPAEVFQAVLESRRLNDEIVNQFGLKALYHKKYQEDAIRELRRHARFKLTQAGTMELSVEDRSPQRAADITNAYIAALDRFNREVRMTKGRRTRQFVEGRLSETKRDLVAAEQGLADYSSKHKAIALSPEVSSSVETAARLFAQRAALQVRLGVIRSYTRGTSDEEEQVVQQLSQLDRQLAAIPETGLELARKVRDVKMLEQLYALLIAQFEEARITEVRDVTTVEVLDPAVPPEKKSRPKRGVMVGVAVLLSLGVGVAWALSRGDQMRGGPLTSVRGG